jgi:hypothetical protein
MYLEVPGIPLVLCSVHSRITCTRLPFFAMIYQIFPFFKNLLIVGVMPFLLMVLIALVDNFKVTHYPVSGM